MHRQTAQFEPLLFNAKHMNQSKNNVASINQKPIHIAPNPFLVSMFGFSIWLVSLFREFSLFAVYFPPCHSARSQRRSRRIHIPKLTLALRERGDRPRRWVRTRQKHFPPNSHPPKRERTPQEKGFLSLVDSTAKCNK